MANGYIGKIAAVVTANSSDFERKLKTDAPKAVDAFARKIQSGIGGATRSAQRSIEQIFTPLQRLERQLKAASAGNLDLRQPAGQIRALVSAAEQINRPLGAATQQFSRLSLEAQGAFLPALKRAQDQVLLLNRKIQETGAASAKSFDIVETSVTRTAAAIQRLSQAQQLASRSLTGNELQFANPRLFETLSRNAEITQRAGALPADALADGGIARQVQQLQRYQAAAVEAQATVSALRLAPNVDQSALDAAERRLSRVIEVARRAGVAIQAAVDAAAPGREATDAAAIAGRIGRGDSLRLASPQQFDALSRSAALSQRAQTLPAGAAGGFGLAGQERAVAQQARAVEQLIASRDRLRRAGQDTSAVDSAIDRQTAKLEEQNSRYESLISAADRYGRKSQEAAQKAAAASSRLKIVPTDAQDVLDSRARVAERFASSGGGPGAAGLALGVDERSLRAVAAEIDLVQGRLAGLAQEARGPVLSALEALRVRAKGLFSAGTLDTEEGRAELQRLRAELVKTLAVAGGGSEKKIAAQLKRVGDIGRGSFGNLSLGIQQAAFAVDDFFSVTGGLDQRIRAAGNNISQLGFILGGTAGLITGISVSIGSQLVAALIKWNNAGVESADQTNALNEALSRQKSIVESLARAFESLADTFSRGIFSESGEAARNLSRSLDEIARKQKELREERIVSLDTDVQQERSRQGALGRQLEGETNLGRRIAVQGLIEQSRQREREAARAAAARGAPSDAEVRRGLLDTVFIDGRRGPGPAQRRQIAEIRDQVRGASGDPQGQLQLLRQALEEQSELALQNSFNQVRAAPARRNVANLQRLIQRIEQQVAEDIDQQALALFRSIDGPSSSIRQAQEQVARAVEAGLPGAGRLAAALDAASDSLANAERLIIERLQAGEPIDQELLDQARGQRQAAEEAFRAIDQQVVATDRAREALERFADALNRVAERSSRDLQTALQRRDEALARDNALQTPRTRADLFQAEEDLRAQRRASDNLAQEVALERDRQQRELERPVGIANDIQAERSRRAALEQDAAAQLADIEAAASPIREQLDAVAGLRRTQSQYLDDKREAEQRLGISLPKTLQKTIATLESLGSEDEFVQKLIQTTNGFSEEMDRVADLLGIEGFEGFWDTLRERTESLGETLGSFDEESKRVSDELASARRQIEARVKQLSDQLGEAQSEFTRNQQRIAELNALIATPNASRTDAEREALVRERASLEQRNQQLAEERVRNAAGVQDAAAELELLSQAAAGRDLRRTPAEQAARQLQDQLQQLRAAQQVDSRRLVERLGEDGARQQLGELEAVTERAAARLRNEAFRQAAPGIFALGDSVQNALLQGPSRAALEATDVSTVEGARELNRLLRGDDAARNQDLVQLQREANRLLQLIAEEQAGVAND